MISYNHNWFHPNEDYKIPDKEIVMKDYVNGEITTNVLLKRYGYDARKFLVELVGSELIVQKYFDPSYIYDSDHRHFDSYMYLPPDLVILQPLSLFGAGLVHNFHVEADFNTAKKFFYSGKANFTNDEEGMHCKEGAHAMVLVGAGRFSEADNEFCLLLQNSWKSKQFVLVTLECFMSCRGKISFLTEEASWGKILKYYDKREPVEATYMGPDDESIPYSTIRPIEVFDLQKERELSE